ncbi:hypothetical protein ACCQ14_14260 [Xanthomonas sp. NCPPB 2865]|jgi:hypothetical protein|uniref:hypothetical protein n=1 Tax=Xanthomonas TaxID=338 RepID=UPI0004633FBD|nr:MULTISPECIES: hypothetical protein [Xanthomonas]MBB3796273.1 hypothetical protein [Xanthomonas arboricola]MBB4707021.1 hypothetical protein [Xanthomonas arboricola]MCC8473472.1 hypothetical protein [Xanthomonas arboricola]MCC8670417.1 hypothetical protein [Xanthomonas arboricola]NJB94573.1 hypothetical protein [Xanthomonas arboricola]
MDASPRALPASASADDLQHLKLLSVFHYVLAAITALFSLFPLIHLFMGIAIITGHLPMTHASADAPSMDPRLFGWFFVVFAAVFIGCGLTLAAFMAYAGRCIAQRRRHLLCLIVAGISCSFMPFGTVVGVFTLVVLLRPQVKALFAPTATAA